MSRRLGRIVIAGGSGFLGRSLIPSLRSSCDEIVVLTRGSARVDGNVRFVTWDAKSPGTWAAELEGAAALVNLVGREGVERGFA